MGIVDNPPGDVKIMQRRWKKFFFSEGDKFTQVFVGFTIEGEGKYPKVYEKKKKKSAQLSDK